MVTVSRGKQAPGRNNSTTRKKGALSPRSTSRTSNRKAPPSHRQNEKATDQFVRDLLRNIGVTKPWEQEGGPEWKRNALVGGSKSKTGKGEGKPEFVFVVNEFVVIVEDKREVRFTRFLEDKQVVTTYSHRQEYALRKV